MTLEKYQELTGITVPAAQQPMLKAQLRRTQAMLETMLGYPLSSLSSQQNLYNELGKTADNCGFTYGKLDTDTLLPPDEAEGNYRLFRYNEHDRFLHVDPFTTLNSAKLVYVQPGQLPNGVTVKTFNADSDELRVHAGRGITKYLERCRTCFCVCECHECLQLAVDANWLDMSCLPDDLAYVFTDMVTFYADCKRDIKSESITTHSYTKFDRIAPETEPYNMAVIQRYAGPYGTAGRMPV